jgi:hypothetical protein
MPQDPVDEHELRNHMLILVTATIFAATGAPSGHRAQR